MTGLLLLMNLSLFGCTSGSKNGFEDLRSRSALLESRTLVSEDISRHLEGRSPLTVASSIASSYGPGDEEHALGGNRIIIKAELNFGDGSGWLDKTVDQETKWYNPEAPSLHDPDFMTQHVYETPGTYTITGRLTYWDGELVDVMADWQVTVIVY